MRAKLNDPHFRADMERVLKMAPGKNNSSQPQKIPHASKAEREGYTIGRLVAELHKLYREDNPSFHDVQRMHEILIALKEYIEPGHLRNLVVRMGKMTNIRSLTGVSGYGNHKGGRRTRRVKRAKRSTRRN